MSNKRFIVARACGAYPIICGVLKTRKDAEDFFKLIFHQYVNYLKINGATSIDEYENDMMVMFRAKEGDLCTAYWSISEENVY